jgi:2-aminoadipate transaminase
MLQALLASTAGPGTLSLALGMPAPELLPRAGLAQAAAAVLQSDPAVLQYTPPVERLKEHVLKLMAARGAPCAPEQVFLAGGAQQGMSLLARILLDPGGRVITERLTYTGFRKVLEPFSPTIVEVPTTAAEGMDLDALAQLLATGPRPALIYTIPHGHNPIGASLSGGKRARLAELAARYGVPVIEDDVYGFLQYGDRMEPPLRALDPDWICYAGSFSKIVAPGLRQGWLVVPERYVTRLAVAKEATDINTATFAQHLLSAYLDTGVLPGHVEELRSGYRARRDAMLHALEVHFPPWAAWRTPEAGLFVWVELPPAVDAMELLRGAVQNEGVAFVPGIVFSSDGKCGSHCMRLNFSHPSEATIRECVARLGRALGRVPRSALENPKLRA